MPRGDSWSVGGALLLSPPGVVVAGQRGLSEQRTTSKLGIKTTRRSLYLCRNQGLSSSIA
jgi:hypothetical protein